MLFFIHELTGAHNWLDSLGVRVSQVKAVLPAQKAGSNLFIELPPILALGQGNLATQDFARSYLNHFAIVLICELSHPFTELTSEKEAEILLPQKTSLHFFTGSTIHFRLNQRPAYYATAVELANTISF